MKLRLDFLAILAATAVVVSAATVIAQGGPRYRGGSRAGEYGMQRGYGGPPEGVPGIQRNPLTQSQREQIARIRRDTQARVRSISADTGLSASEKERKIQQAREQGHKRVMSLLTADQLREYRQWWDSRTYSPPMGRGPAKDPPAGEAIFKANCVVCHGATGTKIAVWKSKVRQMSDAQVQQSIRNGQKGMPAFSKTLSAQQIQAVAGYTKALAGSSQ